MNILGVDFGTSKMGLAWVDTDLGVILPYGMIMARNADERLQKILKFLKTEKIDKIVFGLPLTLEDMSENQNTARIRKFAEDIKKNISIEIDFADERLTTSEARQMGGEATLDEKSAMLILETYLEESS